jgi:hypothetical protein
VVVERSGYGDWFALASPVRFTGHLVETALTNAGGLRCASSMGSGWWRGIQKR